VIRVAYSVEQCWHPNPGGTAVAALRIAQELAARPDEVELHYVAGKHAVAPTPEFRPDGPVAMLPLTRPLLYESWNRLNWPKVEAVTGPVDVAHATGLVPVGTSMPLVVTLHDIAFVHDPDKFSKQGIRVMTRSLAAIGRRADRIVVPSEATRLDCIDAGLDPSRLRLVQLGVHTARASEGAIERMRRRYSLPDHFVLFVGTIEPRKNLDRLIGALSTLPQQERLPLVVVGANGWGTPPAGVDDVDVRFLGFVPDDDLAGIYASATVFAYPSEREGFGLPVAEAMAQATPVVTSAGTSTEEVAAGAAVLVDPFDVASIAAGITEAIGRRDELVGLGLVRAATLTWGAAADATLAVYRELLATT